MKKRSTSKPTDRSVPITKEEKTVIAIGTTVVIAIILSALVALILVGSAHAEETYTQKSIRLIDQLFAPPTISEEDAVKLEDLFNEEIDGIREELLVEAAYHAEQVECLVKAVFFEAGNQSDMGKRWVYHVIHNRLEKKWRGKTTYCEIIYDDKQFSFANAGDRPLPEHAANLLDTERVVLELYSKQVLKDPTCGADHYINPKLATDLSWYDAARKGTDPTGRVILATVGDHVFIGLPNQCTN